MAAQRPRRRPLHPLLRALLLIFAVDTLPDRLARARELGAETIDFNAAHPVEKMKDLTGGIGVLRAIDAVGVDAYRPQNGPAYAESRAMKSLLIALQFHHKAAPGRLIGREPE